MAGVDSFTVRMSGEGAELSAALEAGIRVGYAAGLEAGRAGSLKSLAHPIGALAIDSGNSGGWLAGPETPVPTKEYFDEQLQLADIGYQSMVHFINLGNQRRINWGDSRRPPVQLADPKIMTEQFDEWLTAEKLDYMAARHASDPTIGYWLNMRPNVLAGHKILKQIIQDFDNKPDRTQLDPFWDKSNYRTLYKRYSPEELSGRLAPADQPAVFSILTNEPVLGEFDTIADAQIELAQLQRLYPFLQVPSVMDAGTHWLTRRAVDNLMDGHNNKTQADICHMNLKPRQKGFLTTVPRTFIDSNGRPRLGSSTVQSYNTVLGIG